MVNHKWIFVFSGKQSSNHPFSGAMLVSGRVISEEVHTYQLFDKQLFVPPGNQWLKQKSRFNLEKTFSIKNQNASMNLEVYRSIAPHFFCCGIWNLDHFFVPRHALKYQHPTSNNRALGLIRRHTENPPGSERLFPTKPSRWRKIAGVDNEQYLENKLLLISINIFIQGLFSSHCWWSRNPKSNHLSDVKFL